MLSIKQEIEIAGRLSVWSVHAADYHLQWLFSLEYQMLACRWEYLRPQAD